MTTDEHDPTSQPWPSSQPVDTAGRGGDSEAVPPEAPARNEPEPLTEPGEPAEQVPAEQVTAEAPPTETGPGETDSVTETETPDKSPEPEVSGDPEAARATDSASPAPADSGDEDSHPTAGPAEPDTPPWPDGNGFAPPPQVPADGGALYGNAPFDQFAPPVPGAAFSAPVPEQFPAPGSAQFPQPDPNQFQPANFGPGADAAQAGPGQFQAPNTEHGSGQFPQPDAGQFQAPNTEYSSGQFPQPDAGQFQAPNTEYSSGQFPQPDAGQFQAPNTEYSSGQFPQPAPGQFQPGGPGQNPPDPFAVSGPPTGQYPQQDPNLFPGHAVPGQPPYAPPAPQPTGGYAPPPTPAPDSEPGGPIYSWAPPPMPAAPPPVPQPQYQSAPPPAAHNPPTGQFQPPAWGDSGRPAQQQQYQQPGQPGQPGQQQFSPRPMPEPGQLGNSVNDLNLLKRARKAPRSGWRRAVHKVSRGAINPGESASDVVHRDLVGRVNAPVYGDFRIAILSLKGGVGKTTTTVGLGATFASLRGDRVIAIDANPDLGTLAHRVPRQTRSTVRNLLEDQNITRYSDVRAHTSQSPSRLEVLASEQDPAVSEAFSEADYRRAIGILQSFYNIILTDCGTGLMHSAMSGVLDMASSLVLVTSPAIDGARSASATLDWLDYHGYSHLVQQTVVVVNASRRGSTSVNLDHLRRLFLDRTRAVQVVPFDDHLAEGAEIDLELVSKPTRQALLELAAMVADDFANVDGYPYGNRY
ncbi:MinD/ParA family ATP-binding protein [Nocardia fusca]|uniref:MinD/ParA family ATP-binding protein n=1 Tax=Nocardia fusca TaxID=941183 RepID=UPI001E3F81A3|nr:MinD/ParA family protein [Nocardia fusca]